VGDGVQPAAVRGLVVGVNGSPGAEQALAWAMREAALRRVPLEAVRVWSPSGDAQEREQVAVMRSVAELEDALSGDLKATVAAVKDRTGLHAVPVEAVVSYGHPVKALIDVAGQHNLLVTGSRGRGRVKGMLLGSVSQNCAQYARGPVAAVRGESMSSHPAARVVVGVDGLAASIAALRFAEQAAAVRRAALRVVHAWLNTLSGYGGPLWPRSQRTLREEADATLRDSLRRGLRSTFEVTANGHVEVTGELVEGLEDQVLLDAAAEADLLVVGSRGRGGWAGLLLGSVSQRCIALSPCPVVVVRDTQTPDVEPVQRA
jgi:nucleotide-binding universal stress UspA family protein